MKTRALIAAVLALPLTAAAADKSPLAGRVAGTPQRCITLRQTEGLTIAERDLILFRESGRRIYRATPIGQCGQLQPFNALILDLYSGNTVCENDRFRVLTSGTSIPGPYCRFGKFVPYDRPAKPRS